MYKYWKKIVHICIAVSRLSRKQSLLLGQLAASSVPPCTLLNPGSKGPGAWGDFNFFYKVLKIMHQESSL